MTTTENGPDHARSDRGSGKMSAMKPDADLTVPEGWTLDVRNHESGLTTFYLLPPIPAGDVARNAFEVYVLAGMLYLDAIDLRTAIRDASGAPIGHARHVVTFDKAGVPFYSDDAAREFLATVDEAIALPLMSFAVSVLALYL